MPLVSVASGDVQFIAYAQSISSSGCNLAVFHVGGGGTSTEVYYQAVGFVS